MAAPRRPSGRTEEGKLRFASLIVIIAIVNITIFTVVMIVTHFITMSTPDTLIMSFFAFWGTEMGVLAFKRAIEKSINSYEANFNLAGAYYKQGRYDDATAVYQKLSQDASDRGRQAETCYNLGNTYLQQRKLTEAIEAYKQALRIEPDDKEAKFNLAYAQKLKEEEDKKNDQNNQDQPRNNPDDQNNPDGNQNNNPDNSGNDQDNQGNQDQNNPNDRDNPDDQDDQNQQQPPPPQSERPSEESERMLRAIQANEDNTRQKVEEEAEQAAVAAGMNKQW